jgi:hypothetical protein
MHAGVGDHHAAVAVAHEQHRAVAGVEVCSRGIGVAVEIAERLGRLAVAGEVDRLDLEPAGTERVEDRLPGPAP